MTSDVFFSLEDTLKTLSYRYNFSEDPEISIEVSDSLRRLLSEDFSIKSIFLRIDFSGSYSDFKKALKGIIEDCYRKLRPGGILFVSVDTQAKYDIPLQTYTFSIASGFIPLEKVYIQDEKGLKIFYVFGKVFFPRQVEKYATKRGFQFQPYNLCTKDIPELERGFHGTFSAFQDKSLTKWLSDRLMWELRQVQVSERLQQEDEDLSRIEDPWTRHW